MAAEKINFITIKTKNQGMFISDNVKTENYFNSKMPSLFFDDKKLIATFKKDWYKIEDTPKKLQIRGADTYINNRYELKAGFPVSELTPQVIQAEDFDSADDIAGLYERKSDKVEGQLEDVEFEIELLSEEDEFFVEKPKYTGTPNILTQLNVNPALHSERPLTMSGKQFYPIVRNYIKSNIDGRYAKITSDYNFCLSVEKVIGLAVPHKYIVDVGTKRKSRLETRYTQDKKVKVFETSPEGYGSYPIQEGISGKNQKELEENIDSYLKNLIEVINKPLKECPNCNGTGCVSI